MESAAELAVYEGIHCNLAVRRPAPRVLLVEISGRDIGEFGAAPLQALEKHVRSDEAVELFIDARRADGASIEVSNDWAQWLGKHRSQFGHISMLTGSRFIEVTADFVRRYAGLGGVMRIYSDPAVFDKALEDAVSSSKRG